VSRKESTDKECATVTAREAVCKTDGSGGYTYTFSVTNNTGNQVTEILLTPDPGSGLVLGDQTFPLTTPLANGQSTTLTVDIKSVKPGTEPCFFVTLMSKDGPCCTVKVCPVLPDCCGTATGKFECDSKGTYTGTFTIVNTSANTIKNIYLYPPAGVTLSQTYFAVTVAPGQSFTTPVISIKGAKPGRFCFRVSMHTEDMKDCCSVEVCIVLPECESVSGSVVGRVVDPRNTPIAGVEVSVPGQAAVITNSKGEFEIRDLQPTARLAVSFRAPGFMNTTRILQAGQSPGNGTTVVIWARAAPVPLDAARGGKVSFSSGGGVTIPANSLVDNNGRAVRGTVMVSLTQLDVSDRNQLRTMAGDFKAEMADKSIRMLESFGVFEIAAVDERGQRADLAPGKAARFELPVPRTLRERAPRRPRLFNFDTVSGLWIEQSEVVLTHVSDQLVYTGTITRFDWEWNVDDPLDTTCITVKFIDVFGSNQGPIANALVEATGVTYNTISSGYTNSQGLVCLLVKINSAITIKAYDPLYPNFPIGPLNVMSPNIVSGASNCGDSTLCPLIMTVEQDARLLKPDPNRAITAWSRYPRHVQPRVSAENVAGNVTFLRSKVTDR